MSLRSIVYAKVWHFYYPPKYIYSCTSFFNSWLIVTCLKDMKALAAKVSNAWVSMKKHNMFSTISTYKYLIVILYFAFLDVGLFSIGVWTIQPGSFWKVSNPIIIADIRKIFFLVKNLQLYNLLRGKEPWKNFFNLCWHWNHMGYYLLDRYIHISYHLGTYLNMVP